MSSKTKDSMWASMSFWRYRRVTSRKTSRENYALRTMMIVLIDGRSNKDIRSKDVMRSMIGTGDHCRRCNGPIADCHKTEPTRRRGEMQSD